MKIPTQTLHLVTIESADDIRACHPLMQELRPHLLEAENFCAQIQRQRLQGYKLLAAKLGEDIVGLAGYRETENTIYGRFIYVDDLVVSSKDRRSGVGALLLDEIEALAQKNGFKFLILDTGLSNSLAQRFYFRSGFLAKGMHFVKLM